MLTRGTTLRQVEITTGSVVLKVRVDTKKTEQLHHEDKMKIGISMLEVVKECERPVKESEKSIVTGILVEGIRKQFGKIKRYRGFCDIVVY